MTPEERIAELEANCKAMTAEIEKLKAELAEKNETVWIPESGEEYSYVSADGRVETVMYVEKNEFDIRIIHDMNAVFKPTKECEKHLEWYRDNVLRIQNKLMQLHELLCPDYFPDWNNTDETKYYLYYNTKDNEWLYTTLCFVSPSVVYFTAEAAKKACEILDREKFMMEST